jgi:hypothetical protein
MFSTVEHLTFEYEINGWLPEEQVEANRVEWHKLLRLFSNVKTLCIDNWRLVEEISRCLQLDDGEHPLEPLPRLQEVTYSGSGNSFTSFIDARRNAGRPITLVCRSPSPSHSVSSFETSSITPAS